MTHQFVHACAGSGKTQYVIDHCSQSHPNVRRLIITLTLTGQDEIEGRLQKNIDPSSPAPEVTGWYAFLTHHIVRPYLPLLFPKQRVTGFIFDAGDARESLRYKKKTDPRRYFSETGMIYKDNLEELATGLIDEADGLVENRLRLIYDEILIDEAQDVSRSGLDVIARLLRQDSVRCMLVGDSRQSLLDSSLSSRKNRKADRQNLMEWYRQFENSGRLKIVEKVETYRFNQTIADFSDTIFPKRFGFSSTMSRMNYESSHDGVFLVAKEDLDHYVAEFTPTVLRHSSSSWRDQTARNPITFGNSKGRTYQRVIILATGAIQDFCLKGKELQGKSACAFYVAVTRAQYSVAIVMNQSRKKLLKSAPLSLSVWNPECEILTF
ncbi:UvrD-helicase domain-containing protein [Corynebacterium sp. Marseille-P3884]|uniref:UvrD-helicase domain-containing protein n=1 Tax=Corynebacterium sp. Marseille-P3884 TaxID=2495409 RepID=UPI001FF09876|nr:UvrD-helicase domain-containing protein [Corynebacterium sp. Marseille-P3884]